MHGGWMRRGVLNAASTKCHLLCRFWGGFGALSYGGSVVAIIFHYRFHCPSPWLA